MICRIIYKNQGYCDTLRLHPNEDAPWKTVPMEGTPLFCCELLDEWTVEV